MLNISRKPLNRSRIVVITTAGPTEAASTITRTTAGSAAIAVTTTELLELRKLEPNRFLLV